MIVNIAVFLILLSASMFAVFIYQDHSFKEYAALCLVTLLLLSPVLYYRTQIESVADFLADEPEIELEQGDK